MGTAVQQSGEDGELRTLGPGGARRTRGSTSHLRQPVISRVKPSFWQLFNKLPENIQEQARESYARFEKNPDHPGLSFKKLKGTPDWWSVRVSQQYRAVGARDGETICWFWIGTHEEYNRFRF